MALKRAISQRLFNISERSNAVLSDCRISTSSKAVKTLIPPTPPKVAPDPGDDGGIRRFLQWRPIYQSAAQIPEFRSLPTGDKLLEKLRAMDNTRDRIRLDGLIPPPSNASETTREGKLTVEDARKLLRVSQLEMVKLKLRQIPKDRISLSELVQICSDCSNAEQGPEFAKTLDQSGNVIVLGNVVHVRPAQANETNVAPDLKRVKGSTFEMVLKVLEGLMSKPAAQVDEQTLKELDEMEKQKAAIDRRADYLVRRELWCGLGYFVLQTAAFMRLTFWELTWDVMEPICFYVTSGYFMAGYAFFLITSKEPSFEGFFQSRFDTKRKRLMKKHNFDVAKYNQLRRACCPHRSSPEYASSSTPSLHSSEMKKN